MGGADVRPDEKLAKNIGPGEWVRFRGQQARVIETALHRKLNVDGSTVGEWMHFEVQGPTYGEFDAEVDQYVPTFTRETPVARPEQ